MSTKLKTSEDTPSPEPSPEMMERAERMVSLIYDHAVAMHESIIAYKGAVGWGDPELVKALALAFSEVAREATIAERVRITNMYSAAVYGAPKPEPTE